MSFSTRASCSGLYTLIDAIIRLQSHHYADFCFAHGAKRPPPPALVSTIKLRRAGFHDCIDTEDMFRELFAAMREWRLLPRY